MWGPPPLLYEMYGGGVITGTYTSKLRPSGREVMNMSMCHVNKIMYGG